MNIAGIITEYNPFHLGHKLHLETTRSLSRCDGVICVMSGNFMQRGEPAFIDKWTRAEIALRNGVDLVIELPTVFALSSAEFFAFGSVSLLDSLGVVNSICFGSEHGDVSILNEISSLLTNESLEFKSLLKEKLKKGESLTTSRSRTVLEILSKSNRSIDLNELDKILNSSNNILGIEYIKAINRLNSSITPLTFKRNGGSYNSKTLDSNISSATSIREFLKAHGNIKDLYNHLPSETYKMLNNLFKENYDFVDKEKMFSFLKYKSTTSSDRLKDLPDVKEGLDNKILKEFIHSKGMDPLIMNVKSKRYTYTRISRILSQFFLGFEEYPIESLRTSRPDYARVLGLNKKGAEILKEIKKHSDLEIINKVPKHPNPMLSIDINATNAYSLICNSINFNDDYKKSPVIIMDNY
ncbi:nucleotidyltransferase [Clostridium intestinale]|uniref:tRNA(Met) cytidine acetate ligase n=1 Tax=Clostridium intestinale TaxID=36845 RepID=A0A7D6VU78_9CLOT|nr:nucleotidyltransferase [Clostridium intestinale]QLY81988.1 nucleotidyltransferase [Clostridium intestinale]